MLALPAVAGKFGVRRRRFHDESIGGLGHQHGGRRVRRRRPPTRIVNMNLLGQRRCAEISNRRSRRYSSTTATRVATAPEQNKIRAGLEREDLFTVVHEQVLTDTARYADVMLPATTFLEHTELRRSYGSMIAAARAGRRSRRSARPVLITGSLASCVGEWDWIDRAIRTTTERNYAGDRRHFIFRQADCRVAGRRRRRDRALRTVPRAVCRRLSHFGGSPRGPAS